VFDDAVVVVTVCCLLKKDRWREGERERRKECEYVGVSLLKGERET
jgi:hypothetical protein